MTQAVVLAKGNVLTKEHLILKKDEDGLNEDASNIIISLAEVEKKHIKRILELTEWNKTEAARILGIAKSTLYKKIEEFGLTESRHS